MSYENPAITRKDAKEIATYINAALLCPERWQSAEQAISMVAISLAHIVSRDGRITAEEFLKLCGIEKGPYNRIVVDALKGMQRLDSPHVKEDA